MDFKHDAYKLLGALSRAMGAEITSFELGDECLTVLTRHRIGRPDARAIKDFTKLYVPHCSLKVNTKKREIIIRPKMVG